MKRIIFLFIILSAKIIAQPNYCLTLGTNSITTVGMGGLYERTELNNDGKHDYISTGPSFSLSVHLSNGSLGFNPAVIYPYQISYNFKITDCNNDGNNDVITSDTAVNFIKIISGTSIGTFTNSNLYNSGTKPYKFTIEDFNNDGKKDIAIINKGTTQISVLIGVGTGSFSSPQILNCAGIGENIESSDFDNDGKKDLLISYSNNSNITIYKGNGNGTFNFSSTYTLSSVFGTSLINDLNNDSKSDIAILSSNSTILTILNGGGNCTFTSQTTYTSTGSTPIKMASGDINGDNIPDIAIHKSPFTAEIFLSNSSGGFLPVITNTLASPLFTSCPASVPYYIDITDFNYDGKNDVLLGSDTYSCAIIVLENCNSVGLSENDLTTNWFKVFPNPAKDVLYIELTEQASTPLSLTNNKNNEIVSHPELSRRVFIINTLGQTVLQQYLNGDKTSINLNDLKAGFYFIEVQTEFGVLSKKIVIEK